MKKLRITTKWKIFALLIIPVVLLSSCGPAVTPPLPTPQPPPTPQLPAPSPSPTPSPPTPPTSQQPLNVTLDYIAVKSNRAPTSTTTGNVYLLLVVTDGYQKAAEQFLPAHGTFNLNNYETLEPNQLIFHTDSAGDWLKVCILAYQQNDPQWLTSILMPALAKLEKGLAWADYRSMDEILATTDELVNKSTIDFINGGDTLIGYYEDVWGINESRGIGQYNGVGSDDLRLWFSIWSVQRPQPVAKPTLLPDITLDNVDMADTISLGQTRTDIITIVNKEVHPVMVTLKGTSSETGEFFNSTVELAPAILLEEDTSPKEARTFVESYSVCNTTGPRTITYDLYYRDTKLDSWSGTLNVSSTSQITLVEWRNSTGSFPIETTMEGALVTLYVKATGHDGKDLNASIRRVEPTGGYSNETTISIKISSGSGLGKWTARWQEVTDGNPRYVFVIEGVYSAELTVNRRYKPPPDVAIYNVAMVSQIFAGQERTDTITLKNGEDELVVVRLKGYSSVDGEFYNRAVSIPEDSYTSVEIQSSFETPGIRTITYKLYYEDAEFDSWSGSLDVL